MAENTFPFEILTPEHSFFSGDIEMDAGAAFVPAVFVEIWDGNHGSGDILEIGVPITDGGLLQYIPIYALDLQDGCF